MPENMFNIILIIHIGSGFTALLCGLFAIVAKKGKPMHRNAGKIFFIAMIVVAVSAIFMSVAHRSMFLFTIGIFAFFQDYFGYRAIKNKSMKPSAFDWVVLVLAAVNSIVMISTFQIVLMVFGGISASLAYGVFRTFLLTSKDKEIPKKSWLAMHIGMMLGAYIATSTAFLVVNIKSFQPSWLPWLIPTILGVPLIFYFTNKFTGKKPRPVFTRSEHA